MAKPERAFWTFRPRDRRPFSADCKPAFRRICGTCEAFPAGAGFLDRGQKCARLEITVNGGRNAAGCHLWARKLAALAAPQGKDDEV